MASVTSMFSFQNADVAPQVVLTKRRRKLVCSLVPWNFSIISRDLEHIEREPASRTTALLEIQLLAVFELRAFFAQVADPLIGIWNVLRAKAK